jgi:hypothetical protein
MATMVVTTTATTGSVPLSGLPVAVLAIHLPVLANRLVTRLVVGPAAVALRGPEMKILTTGVSLVAARPLRTVPGHLSSRRWPTHSRCLDLEVEVRILLFLPSPLSMPSRPGETKSRLMLRANLARARKVSSGS